jgi:hypothetical protein
MGMIMVSLLLMWFYPLDEAVLQRTKILAA